jgi:hypothetical protein
MTSTDPFTAKDWRDRADEARARAEKIKDPEAKQVMLEIAAAYDRLAEIAEKEFSPGPKSN